MTSIRAGRAGGEDTTHADEGLDVRAMRSELDHRAKKLREVIVVGVRYNGTVDVVSHGREPDDRRIIGNYAQEQFGRQLPRIPFQTWFGWGNGGKPLALSPGQVAQLSDRSRRYLRANTYPDAEQRL